MAPDPLRCSNASAGRDEPLGGTAPHARRWLLIEHPGPWAKQPLETVPLAGEWAGRIDDALTAHHGRVLLIRPPGRQPEDGEARLWRVVDMSSARATSGTWTHPQDLVEALAALAAPDLEAPAPSMVLICTHGVRDVCCALKGRPVVGMASRAFPDEVWECSHLNGHRFAATALVLPDGTCYGRMDQADAVRILTQHRVGRIDPEYLRGRTDLTPAAQAAQIWGLTRLAVLDPEAPRGADSITVAPPRPLDAQRSEVEIGGLGEPVVVEVLREDLPPAPLSCGKAAEGATAYRVVASRLQLA